MGVEWYFYGVIAAIAGAVGGAMAGYYAPPIADKRLRARVDALESRVDRMHLASISGDGQAAKAEKAERTAEAMAAGLDAMQKAGDDEGAKKKALLAVAAQYPDVALQLIGKMMKGGFKI